MPRRAATLRGATAAAAAVALTFAAGCGGGGSRQDAGEVATSYRVAVPRAAFPARQDLAEHVRMRIAVHNLDRRMIPNIAATIETVGAGTQAEAFARLASGSGLASRSRPIWVLDAGPVSGDTAAPNTWALGPLAAGQTKVFSWSVTSIQPGRFALAWKLSGSLTGRSRLRLANGAAPHGTFAVNVSRAPAQARVTRDGTIVRVPGD